MDNMPDYKDGFVNMPKDGGWVSVPLAEINEFIKNQPPATPVNGLRDDNQNSSDVPAGA